VHARGVLDVDACTAQWPDDLGQLAAGALPAPRASISLAVVLDLACAEGFVGTVKRSSSLSRLLAFVLSFLPVAAAAEAALERRGAVPTGVSLAASLGVTEGLDPSSGRSSLNFTQEVALSYDATPRWTAQLAGRFARGNQPATLAFSGSVLHRFVWLADQKLVPGAGVGLVVAAASATSSSSGVGLGISAEGCVEWRIARWFGLTFRAAWTFLVGGFGVGPLHFFHQTLGVVLSL